MARWFTWGNAARGGGLAGALWVAVATLVATCPCALSLATPVALTACVNALSRRGVLVASGRAIEALASATHLVFDKTGTLTTGRMHLTGKGSSDSRLRIIRFL